MAKLSTLLDQIDNGTILLPEFQRGYVWNRDQVRGLMRSVYLGHPVGSLLMWETTNAEEAVQGVVNGAGAHLLLLDGQQRMTTLYGVIRGKAPAFFQGNTQAFTDLYFNLESQAFEFYMPNKMKNDPLWVDVTGLFQQGLVPYLTRFTSEPEKANRYLPRLNALSQIVDRDFHYESITDANQTIDDVVEIFNRVNSGGTKLSKGDLALARRCAVQPGIRATMRQSITDWEEAGFSFSMDWLLRNATAVATGRALFTSLENVEPDRFATALKSSVDHVGTFLDAVSGRLGLDHDRVLMGRYAAPVVSRLLELNGGRFSDAAHRDKVLYWYVHSALWGRYAGSTETFLQLDYDAVNESGVEGLLQRMSRWRGGNLDVRPHDFEGATRGSRFYPLLYMLTRVHGARDFGSGLELKAEMLGKLSSLQVHHVFPKKVLREARYDNRQVNAIANFCFLTQDTNLEISARTPEEYFPEVEERHPGALASQWIPMDPALWKVENYPDFLAARRELLAGAAQDFLSGLASGKATTGPDAGPLRPMTVLSAEPDDARSVQVQEMVDELRRLGFAEPELDAVISDPERGRVIAEAEAFWPDGFQHGVGKPAVLELDPDQADLPRLQELGYEVFTSVEALLGFVDRLGQDAAGEAADEPVEEVPASGPETADFGRAMLSVYERAKSEADYTATFFLGMLSELGPLGTARKLLHAPAVSDGFANLWERGRLDLTVEALVLRPEFSPLFTDEELTRARARLEQFGHRFLDAV
ncbi:GmrSD restriction endonuclease domain-containing protein [Nocardiopsis alborubida]|uniref:DUF262 domain-containing protein n=1 Tax=Nocardiopsis alborubida TaxID=146802 RepID=A0A7X6RS67_9ACTN|nr:DUF262 domain-containing protein [Nocardiopsis alborubida]NKY99986.1 DUF262 domain-containing protein [Nocardiopsis alborubida]